MPPTRSNGRLKSPQQHFLLESRIGERFDAIVTGASPKGTWVRLLTYTGRRETGAWF